MGSRGNAAQVRIWRGESLWLFGFALRQPGVEIVSELSGTENHERAHPGLEALQIDRQERADHDSARLFRMEKGFDEGIGFPAVQSLQLLVYHGNGPLPVPEHLCAWDFHGVSDSCD